MSEPNRKRKKKRRANEAKSYVDSSYVCDFCGEDIVIPIDLSAGSEQQYVEVCPELRRHLIGKLQEMAEGTIVEGMSIIEDDNDKLWTAALGAGAFMYDEKQKIYYPIKEDATAIEVFAVYKDNRGDLWLGTHNGGAYKFKGKTFEKFRP